MRLLKLIVTAVVIFSAMQLSAHDHRGLFNLKGPVKKAVFITNISYLGFPEPERILSFSPDGNLLEFEEDDTDFCGDAETLKATDIKDGQIVRGRIWHNGLNGLITRFTCSTPEMMYISEPSYSASGDMIGEEIKVMVGNDEYESSASYTVLERDNYGNWTKRKASIKGSDNLNTIESCLIEYYTPQEIEASRLEVRKRNSEAGKSEFEKAMEEDPELAELMEAIDEDAVYDIVEQMPEYSGGPAAMMSFIAHNLKYPLISQENGEQGKVIVNVIVDKDGSLMIVDTLGAKYPNLIKEAKRVVEKMPPFKPGIQNGKPVKVKFSIPVNFRLS